MAKQLTDDDLKHYYSIGEVAKALGVTTAKIRSWDKEFNHIKPTKNGRGERRFTKQNLEQLRQVNYLINERHFTTEGARREIAASRQGGGEKAEVVAGLREARARLLGLLDSSR